MSAKRPQTDHAKALAAFQGKWITRAEYQDCITGNSWVCGRAIYTWRNRRGVRRPAMTWFLSRGKVSQ